MASTYSTNLGIELIGTGDQSGTWGTTTNTNLGTLIEQAIAGYSTQAVTDSASATVLSITNGTSSTGRNAVISLTGALTAARVVEVPAKTKTYIFANNTTGGFAVTVKVTGQTGVSIAAGNKALVYCDGTDVRLVVSDAGSFTALSYSTTLTGGTGIVNLGSGQFYKDASGNVGIGTSSPSQKLQVVATTNQLSLTTGSQELIARATSSEVALYTFQALPMVFYTNNTEKMRIDSSGNVGIGVTPTYQFEIKTANDALLRMVNSGATQVSQIQSTNLARSAYAPLSIGGSYTVLETGGSERMRIDTSGNVGIGTVSPAAKLAVTAAGDATFSSQIIVAPASGANPAKITFNPTVSSAIAGLSDGSVSFYGNGANTERFRIGPSGQLGIGGAVYGTAGQVLTSGGSGAAPTWSTAAGVASDRQVFNASGTWTKPSSGTYVRVQIWGSGGGGGGTSTANNTGAGGAGGGYSCTTFLLSDIAAGTVSVTINAAGTGNTGSGTAGGSITFGTFLTHLGGGVSSTFTIGCNTYTGLGRSGYLSAQSGITLVEGSSELSRLGNGSTYPSENNTASLGWTRNETPNMFAPGHGGFKVGTGGTSTFGGSGGAFNGSGVGGAGTAPGGGGGGSTGSTGGAGAIGRVIVTVF